MPIILNSDKEHDNDPKDMYEVQQQMHMRNVDHHHHHHHTSNSPSRLLSLHSQPHPLQSNPPVHQPQKSHHLQQLSQVSSIH